MGTNYHYLQLQTPPLLLMSECKHNSGLLPDSQGAGTKAVTDVTPVEAARYDIEDMEMTEITEEKIEEYKKKEGNDETKENNVETDEKKVKTDEEMVKADK